MAIDEAFDLEALASDLGCEGRVIFEDGPHGPVVRLAAAGATASVALQGAQLLSWRPAGHDEVIWLSSETVPKPGKSLRGGTPVCWPWFGADPDGRGRPAHGFVRGLPWTPAYANVNDDETVVAFRFKTTEEHRAIWPHSAEVTLVVGMTGQGLDLDLLTTNTGDAPFALTQALHTYFAVGDIARTSVRGLAGCTYIDTVGEITRRVDACNVTFEGEVDRIYLDPPAQIEIDDAANNRSIVIASRGSRSAVVWNPWIEKSARLGDMGAEGYRRMVCVETANAADDSIGLEPGGTHMLEATYSVTRT